MRPPLMLDGVGRIAFLLPRVVERLLFLRVAEVQGFIWNLFLRDFTDMSFGVTAIIRTSS